MTRTAIALLLLLAASANAQDGVSVFHDAAGRVTGKATTRNGATTFYDSAGRVTGKTRTNAEGTTTFYDAAAHVTGKATVATEMTPGAPWSRRLSPRLQAGLRGHRVEAPGLAVFALLRYRERPTEIFLYAFDLLELDGQDLRREPLETRKATLANLLRSCGPGLQLVEHLAHDGDVVFRHACRLGCEGIVSKRLGSPYVSGRTRHWLKSRTRRRRR